MRPNHSLSEKMGGRGQGALETTSHAVWIITGLATRNGDHGEAVSAEPCDLQAVTLEGEPDRVSPPAIKLNDDPGVPPQEVDLVAMSPGVGLEPVDACAPKQPKHRSFAA
jgi:hypothetical protein